MNAIETDLFRAYPPLEPKDREESSSEEREREQERGLTREELIRKRLRKYQGNPNLSSNPDIAVIQVLYPTNFVITLKNHLSLRGVKNSTIMTTPEELEKLLKPSSGASSDSDDGVNKKRRRKNPHTQSLSMSLNKNDIVLGTDDDPLIPEDQLYYDTIDIDKYLNSTDDIVSFLEKTETSSNATIKDEDGNCKLNIASYIDAKVLDIKHKHTVQVMRLYEDKINDLIVDTTDLKDLLDEYKGLVAYLLEAVERLDRELHELEDEFNEYKENNDNIITEMKEREDKFECWIDYLASLHNIDNHSSHDIDWHIDHDDGPFNPFD